MVSVQDCAFRVLLCLLLSFRLTFVVMCDHITHWWSHIHLWFTHGCQDCIGRQHCVEGWQQVLLKCRVCLLGDATGGRVGQGCTCVLL
jgi:hypothetical protein